MAVDWSTLLLDLLGVIVLKLETFEDFINFSVVCRCWNHASLSVKQQWSAKPQVPWLLLAENNKDNPDCVRKIYNLSNNKCYNFNLHETFGARCWGSSYGWVAMIDRNLDVQLFNPITKAQICFPSLKPLYDGDESHQNGESHQHWFLRGFARRLIVLKVPQNNHYEFVVLVVYEYYHSLAFARQGNQSWTPVLVKSEVQMLDVVGMEDKVFALYEDGSIVSWNVEEFNALELIKPTDYSPFSHEFFVEFNSWVASQTYLIQSGTDLLAVLRYREEVSNEDDHTDYDDENDTVYDNEDEDDYFCRTINFEVYRFKFEDKSWEEIEDLGEVALVIGGNSSMCVSVTHSKGLQRNCIYFTDDLAMCWLSSVRKPGGHDTGVFDIKSRNVGRFYEGDDMHSSFSPPILFIPQF